MESKLMSKTFLWMFIGLFVTFLTGLFVSINPTMLFNVFNSATYIILCIVELVLVIALSANYE